MPGQHTMLKKECIVTDCAPESVKNAIRRSGLLLVQGGYAEEAYIEGMLARDQEISTAIGNAIAIPHGTNAHRRYVRATGLSVLTYPEGLDWNGESVKLVIGIAASGDEHLGILQSIAEAFMTEEAVDEVVRKGDADMIYALLTDNQVN